MFADRLGGAGLVGTSAAATPHDIPRCGSAAWLALCRTRLGCGRKNRLHDRLRYRLAATGPAPGWVRERLAP